MENLDENRKFIFEEVEECECGHDDDCGCGDGEELQDGYHVLYCRGYLFDAVGLFDLAAGKAEKKTAKTMSLYNNFAIDIQKNYIAEEEPVILIEYDPDMLEYVPMPESDLKGRGFVLISGAQKIKNAYESGQPTIEYVTLKMEEFYPLMLMGAECFAEHWNESIDNRLHSKELYLISEHEREMSCE